MKKVLDKLKEDFKKYKADKSPKIMISKLFIMFLFSLTLVIIVGDMLGEDKNKENINVPLRMLSFAMFEDMVEKGEVQNVELDINNPSYFYVNL